MRGVGFVRSKSLEVIQQGASTGPRKVNVKAHRSEAKSHALIHALPVGIFQANALGECIYVNERWCEITGLDAEKSWGFGWTRALHPEDRERIVTEWHTALKKYRLFKSVYRFLHPDGRTIWVYGQTTGEKSKTGEIIGYLGTITDITDQKRFEQRLIQQQSELCHAQRLITAGELMGVMVHELNQPIGAIANYLEGAAIRYREELKSNPELAEMVEHTRNLAEHAIHITRNLRALLRRQDPGRQRVDINALIRETVRLIDVEITRRQVGLSLDLASNIRLLWGNRTHLQQLLLNLTLNGMDAMETMNSRDRQLIIRTRNMGQTLEVCVIDTGIGFSEDLATRLFEPFMTTKKDGVGLGLSMCRMIAEAHGGEISADSRLGQGASFRVILPIERRNRDYSAS
jgi:PAS domain S-box-containing protein